MQIDVHDEYQQVRAFYDEAEEMLGWPDERLLAVRAGVSGWSPAQHLHHIAVANGMLFKGVQLIVRGGSRVPSDGGPNALGVQVLTSGTMPRGGTSPENVRPPDVVTREAVTEALRRSRERFEQTAPLLDAVPEAPGRLPHPILGPFSGAEWIRFARIHAQHHLGIIREITAAAAV